MTVTLTTYDVTAERMDWGEVGTRTWTSVDGVAHEVQVGRELFDRRWYVWHTKDGISSSLRYSTPIAALAAFHAIGPGIHPPRLLTERETQEP